MQNLKEGIKEFVIGFFKAVIFIVMIVLLVYLFFVLADFIKEKFNIDLYGPAGILGSLFVTVVFVMALYHKITYLLK